jgi:hypothetical protein
LSTKINSLFQGILGEKLLGIPKLSSGTGANQADATFESIQQWGLTENIAGMSFDTTSSNTGSHNGAAVLLEAKFGKRLIYLACRHHILELLAESVFSTLFDKSTGIFFIIDKNRNVYQETVLFNRSKNSNV